jgi:hypothetical protein
MEKIVAETAKVTSISLDRTFGLPKLLAFRLLALSFVLFIRNVCLFLAPITFIRVAVLVAVRGSISGYSVVNLGSTTGRKKHRRSY